MTCRSGLLTPVLAAAVLAAFATAPAPAQQPGKPQIIFTKDAAGTIGVVRELRVRPNIRSPFFLHLRNDGAAAKVRLDILAGGEVIASKPLDAGKGITPVIFGKAPPPKDGKPVPLQLDDHPGPLTLLLYGAGPDPIDRTSIDVAHPDRYVTPKITFDPNERPDGKKNVLEVRLTAREKFGSPPARVDLVLRPDRIPGLVPGQKKQGTYGGLLRPGEELVLRAENLQFRDEASSQPGVIYLTVDGYERAFAYHSTFLAEKTVSEPRPFALPVLRLVHPPFAKPGDKLKVTAEADGIGAGVGEVAMFRELTEEKKLAGLEGEPGRFDRDRRVRILFAQAGPNGALVFEPKVSDWTFEFETEGVFGDRFLRLRLIDPKKDPGKGQDVTLPFIDSLAFLRDGGLGGVRQSVSRVLLSDTPPEAITVDVNLPRKKDEPPKLRVGTPLPLKATAIDPTGIKKVVFFAGKPPADGKFPPTQPNVEGDRLPGPDEVWVADLNAPTEKLATLVVGVQMTNGVGVTTTKTIQVQLIDPNAKGGPGEKKLATVTGKVMEGSRAVPGVPVTLAEEKGGVKGAATTDKNGEFKFENIPPGAYVVTAVRSASRTRGQTLVAVPEGKEKVTGADVKLTR